MNTTTTTHQLSQRRHDAPTTTSATTTTHWLSKPLQPRSTTVTTTGHNGTQWGTQRVDGWDMMSRWRWEMMSWRHHDTLTIKITLTTPVRNDDRTQWDTTSRWQRDTTSRRGPFSMFFPFLYIKLTIIYKVIVNYDDNAMTNGPLVVSTTST